MAYTPESYNQRVSDWLTDVPDEADWGLFPRRTPEERAQRRIGDSERIAITLLSKGTPTHPVLALWIRRLATDPTYSDGLPMMPECDESGYGTKRAEYLVELAYPDEADKYDRARDTALLHLGYAVEMHRDRGEDGAETTQSLGFGLGVRTSLAAAVAEYHQAMLHIITRGRPTSLPINHWEPTDSDQLLWENEHVEILQGRCHPSETQLYVHNKRTGQCLAVQALARPM